MIGFIKVRYRRVGTIEPSPYIDIDGLVNNTTIGISPGSAYALRDALSAALDDYEKEKLL